MELPEDSQGGDEHAVGRDDVTEHDTRPSIMVEVVLAMDLGQPSGMEEPTGGIEAGASIIRPGNSKGA